MTYNEIWEDSKLECGINVPQLYLTPSFGLLWITEAMHTYQSEIGVSRCTEQVYLDPNSTDGKYRLSCNVGSVEEITLNAQNSSTATYEQIVRMPLDAWHQLIQTWLDQNIVPNNDWWAINQYIDTNLVYCAIEENILYIYPYATSGIVTLRYKPLMVPYSASDTTDWAGWGNDPLSRMKQFGPRSEFIPAITGIKAYVKMRITEMRPNGMKEFAPQYQMWRQDFERAKVALRRRATSYQQDTFQPSSMGGLI